MEFEELARLVSFEVSNGADRTAVVQRLIQTGIVPDDAQAVWELGAAIAAADGRLTFRPWLRAVMTSPLPSRGKVAMLVLGLAIILISLPTTVAWALTFPEGRYPVLLLGLPSVLLAGVAIYFVGALFFRFWIEPAARAEPPPSWPSEDSGAGAADTQED